MLGLGGAVGWLLYAFVTAVRLSPEPPAAPGHGTDPAVPRWESQTGERLDLRAAIERDPFHPERRPPVERYRFPGQVAPTASEPPTPELPKIRVLGIARRDSSRGVAALQIEGSPVRLLRVGETREGFRLVDVRTGAAVLRGADTTLVLTFGENRPAADF